MFNLEEFEPYLNMSRYNPRFKHDAQYLLRQLDYAKSTGAISNEDHYRIYNALYAIKDGEVYESLERAFTWFIKTAKEGYYNISFKDEEFRDLVTAREISAQFYQWVDVNRHHRDNPALRDYIKKLSTDVLAYHQQNDERMWDSFEQLKSATLLSLSRGLISRGTIDSVAKIIRAFMQEERKIINSIPKRQTFQHMSVFDVGPAEIPYDVHEKGIDLVYLYMTDYTKFISEMRQAHDVLETQLRSGSLSSKDYTYWNSELANYSLYLEQTKRVQEYEPILAFYFDKNRGQEKYSCLTFNEEQITKAMELARRFFRNITNEYVISEMILKKLAVNLADFNHAREIKEFYMKALTHDLDMLKNYGIISLATYTEYMEQGRVKFQ